jgi:hypothetical protein
MSSGGTISGGTLRGTPNRDRRGGIPFQATSPGGSNIPRPTSIHEEKAAEAASTVSASRQKQSKRDEVRLSQPGHPPLPEPNTTATKLTL